MVYKLQKAYLEEQARECKAKLIVAPDANTEVRILKKRKVQVDCAQDWKENVIVAIKVDLEKGKPFPKLNSNLITLTILQFLEKPEAIDILQILSH